MNRYLPNFEGKKIKTIQKFIGIDKDNYEEGIVGVIQIYYSDLVYYEFMQIDHFNMFFFSWHISSSKLFGRYVNWVNWTHVSTSPNLSESFIKKYNDRVYWPKISISQKLSEQFIEDNQDRVNWFHISHYQTLSEEFIIKYHNKVSWYYISKHQRLSEYFILMFHDNLRFYTNNLLEYQDISQSFLERYMNF